MKRIALFLLTNMAVTTALGVIAYIAMGALGIDPQGYIGLLFVSFVIGFAGAIVSLLLSKFMAKRSVGAVVIKEPRNEAEAWLLETVSRQAQTLGLKPPEVAIYEADEMNAFATGAFRNSALVAVSTGLMRQMTRGEVEAVLAHEMSHVNNGDMVTMTLLQGLINTFVIFVSRIVANIAANTFAKNESSARAINFIVYMALQIILMFLANFIVLWFSRRREYRADAGAAKLVGAPNMVAALKRLRQPHEQAEVLPNSIEAFGIAGGKKDSALSTHPSLANRIAALEQGNYGLA